MSIIQALKACAVTRDLERGSNIHHCISSRAKNDSYILTSLIHLYMQCGDVTQAQLLFQNSTKKTLSMHGAMMKGYISNNMASKAISMFNEIKTPNEVIIILLFNACAQLATKETLNLVKDVFRRIPKSYLFNPRLLTSLLDALMECGDLPYAELLFKKSENKSMAAYGAMMKGYTKNNMMNKAIDLFNEIKNPDNVIVILLCNACAQLATPEALNLVQKVFKENSRVFHSNPRLSSSLLDALVKCGDMASAEVIFSKIKKSVINYGIIMNGFLKEDNPKKVLDLFNQMKIDGIEADLIIYLHIIQALSQIGDYSFCQTVIKEIPQSMFVKNEMLSALINIWGRSGSVEEAKNIFENISQSNKIVYTSMINCYGLNGMGLQAVELFHQIPLEYIDEVTNICILNACSHSGLIDEARSIFNKIQIKTEKIYTTMIDCLSRAAIFEEAQNLIDEFERHHSPARSMYMALLSGARNEKNIHLSQKLYDRMKQLFPGLKNSLISAAILLANVYASSGNIERASDIKIQLHQSGEKKKSGLSCTVINGQIYQFRAHDQSHHRSSEIYTEVEKISKELIQHGHEYDSSWITRPLAQDETVASVLCGHSEKLAIAWNFVVNPNAIRIQITKNLRVCGNCHRATKLIAAIRKCEIIVRDANRIHHFYTNGQCSCNDYF